MKIRKMEQYSTKVDFISMDEAPMGTVIGDQFHVDLVSRWSRNW